MIKNRYNKILIICLCIVFIIMSIGTGILAADILHTEHCNIPDCSLCELINMSISIYKNAGIICVNIILIALIIPIIQAINKKTKILKRQTLVELKIIQLK